MRCGDCKFVDEYLHGDRYHPDSQTRTCHRFPPATVYRPFESARDDLGHVISRFPTVSASDWCGEFQPKETGGR